MANEESGTNAPAMREYVFHVEGDAHIADGRPVYPDLLRLQIPTASALEFAVGILNNLRARQPGETMLFEIPLFGKIEMLGGDGASNRHD